MKVRGNFLPLFLQMSKKYIIKWQTIGEKWQAFFMHIARNLFMTKFLKKIFKFKMLHFSIVNTFRQNLYKKFIYLTEIYEMEHNCSMSSGSLRTKISLKGGYSQLSVFSPFYGMKQDLPTSSALLGSDDLISYYNLNGSYNKYCAPKKLREDLASFLPQVCGASNLNSRNDASCSLRQLIEKPPITGKEISNLTATAMAGFKLAPGPVPENYRFFDLGDNGSFSNIETLNNSYQEFGMNFNDPEEVKDKHRRKFKRSLDDLEDNEKKVKKCRSEEKDKDKKPKKKKKDKKKKKNADEEMKRINRKENTPPFF